MRWSCWILAMMCGLGFPGCRTVPYAPPPEMALVESIEVDVTDFFGRPDVYATIRGRLSSNAAQLVDFHQYREGNVLFIEVKEQTPRNTVGTNRMPSPPFQTRVPLEVLALVPGQVYIVDANGVRTQFCMPGGDDPGPLAAVTVEPAHSLIF